MVFWYPAAAQSVVGRGLHLSLAMGDGAGNPGCSPRGAGLEEIWSFVSEQGGLAFGSAFTLYLLCDLKRITVPLEISVFLSVSWEY